MGSGDDPKDRFRRIYDAHYRDIAAYARRRLDRHDADDVIAETFLVAWRRLDDVPDEDLTLPWLYGVARRVLSQGRRSGRRRDRLTARLRMLSTPDQTTVSEVDHLDDRQVVRVALARLRPEDQELLRLAEWEGLTPRELAPVFDCSANAISIRLHRAHRRFREALDSVDGQPDAALQPGRTT
jgi:RNA polymerase sigma-70 factor (ECF subfamily)